MERISRLLFTAGLCLALASGCGGSGSGPALHTDAPAAGGLPALPADGPYFSRTVSDVTTQTGADRLSNSAVGTAPMVGDANSLTLDGTAAGEFAWAIWCFPLTPTTEIAQFSITPKQSGQNKYFYAYADYAQNRWVYSAEKSGGTSFAPTDQAALHSAGEFAYIAILVGAGNTVNIAEIAMDATGPPPEYAIFDQFEDNDTSQTAWPLDPGLYRASIHETYNLNMPGGEYTDVWDFYQIQLAAGQTLVYTMRFEPYDHFWAYSIEYPAPNFNDLDVLFYLGPTNYPLDDFIEANSSTRIYYDSFEQGSYTANAQRSVILGILGDINIADPTDANAEYYLGIMIGTALHEVSGSLKMDGAVPDRDLVAFLEPGNFNFVTALPGNGTPGDFTIPGVPDGTYTLRACVTARFPPFSHFFDASLPVTVDGGDVSGLYLDLEALP